MKVLNLIMTTLIASFTYFGIIKYESIQEPSATAGFIIIGSSLMFLVVMVLIILSAANAELLDDKDTETLRK